jgi:hypothetical protein
MDNPLFKRFAIYAVIGVSIFVLWQGYAIFHAASIIDPSLREQINRQKQVDIVVTLGFRPQPIHTRIFQNFGAVAGVDATRITLLRVPADRVSDLARYYWIEKIEPIPGTQSDQVQTS